MQYQTKSRMHFPKATASSAVFAACCSAAGTMALSAPDSRLLGVVFILALLLSIVVLVGIRILPALTRRRPAF